MGMYDEVFGESSSSANGGLYDDVFKEKKERGGLVAAIKQGIGQTIKGAGQAAGDFVPGVGADNGLKTYGQGVIDANPTTVHSLDDIVDSPWQATKEAVGNAASSMGSIVGTSALGKGISAAAPMAGRFSPLVDGIGKGITWAGPLVAAALPSYGGIREQQAKVNPDNDSSIQDKAIAAAAAGTVGLIENKFGPQEWALSALTKEGRGKLAEQFAAKSIAGSIGKGIVKGGAIEGAEELVQNPIEQLAGYQDPRTPENIKDTLFGGAMGALGGGVVGGAFGATQRPQKQVTPPVEEQPSITDPQTSPAATNDQIVNQSVETPGVINDTTQNTDTVDDGYTPFVQTKTKLQETGALSRAVNAGIDSGATSLDTPLALGYQAGAPLVTFPDGTTMTRAEYEQHQAQQEQARLDGMIQDAPLVRMAERAQERTAETAPDRDLANTILEDRADIAQRRAEVTQRTLAGRNERSQQAIAGDMAQDELAPKPVSPLEKLIASRTDEQLTRLAGQGQRKEVQQAAIAEMQRRMSTPAQPTTTAPQQQAATQFNIPENINAAQPAQVPTQAPQANDAQARVEPSAAQEGVEGTVINDSRITAESTGLNGTTVYDGKGTPYRVHSHRNHLVTAHPIVDGKAQVNRDSSVRFWVTPDRSPSGENDRIDPIYTAPPVKNVNESRGPAPIAKRDDLVGAIMRVTGGKGIAANQAQTIVGDKANAATKVRGLFTNDGTADLGDVAMLLRDEEGYSVKDGEHLSELIREQAAGNPVHSMERTEREASANAEKEYKASVNQKAEELGLKKVGGKRTLAMVEADIAAKEKEISELEAREERAAIQTSVIAEDIYQEGSELTESDLMQWLGGHIDYSQDEINEANTRASERESRRAEKNAADDSQEQAQSRNSEGAGTGSTEAGTRSTEGDQLASEDIVRRAKALGMKTAGVSADRLAKQVEEAEARNAFDLTKQTNEQASAEFKRQQEEANKQDDEPAAPTVKADQVDLFNTQDALFSNNREQPKTATVPAQEESRPVRTNGIGSQNKSKSSLDEYLAEEPADRNKLNIVIEVRQDDGTTLSGPRSTHIESAVRNGYSVVLTASGPALVNNKMQGWNKDDLSPAGMRYANWLISRRDAKTEAKPATVEAEKATDDQSDTDGTKYSFAGPSAQAPRTMASADKSTEQDKSAQGSITQPAAEKRILSLLGDKLGQVLLDSGIVTLVDNVSQLKNLAGAKYMVAWHGSPHDHDKFDSSKIGSGEGAQSFGYGHYFASSRDVAEYYRKTLAVTKILSEGQFNSDGTPNRVYQAAFQMDAGLANEDIEDGLEALGHSKEEARAIRKEAGALFSKLEKEQGKLYEVELAPSENEYLDWDRPLSEQSDTVKSALGNVVDLLNEERGTPSSKHPDLKFSGSGIYGWISKTTGGDKAASDYLHSIGIRGIRYLDGSSRGAGEGNSNYVIFSDDDVSITAKYAEQDGDIQGATLPNGRIALVLDNLTADNFDGVLSHEGFHSTIKELVGQETYAKLMKQLDNLLTMGKGSQWVQAAKAAVPKNTKPENVTEEIGAYSIEQYVNGAKLPNVLQRWAQSFLSAIRTAIIKHLPNGKLKLWAISNIAAQDLSKLAIAGLKAKAADQLQGQGREAMAFSQSADDSVYSIKRLKDIATAFAGRVTNELEKVRGRNAVMIHGNTPASMQMIGWADRRLMIEPSELEKIAHKAGFETDGKIGNLVFDLARPGAMFWNEKNGSLNILRRDQMFGAPALIAIRPDTKIAHEMTHLMVTAHKLDNQESLLRKISSGELKPIYLDPTSKMGGIIKNAINKKKYRVTLGGLAPENLHARASVKLDMSSSLLSQDDLVKWEQDNWGDSPKFSKLNENDRIAGMPNDKTASGRQNAPAPEADIGEAITDDMRAKILDESRWLDRGLKIRKGTKIYRGESETTGRRSSNEGVGLYTTTDKTHAEGYGSVREMSHDDLPNNPIRFRDVMTFDEWRRFVTRDVFGFRRESDFEKKYGSDVGVWVRNIDSTIDGVQIGVGHGAFFVKWRTLNNEPSASAGSDAIRYSKAAQIIGDSGPFAIPQESKLDDVIYAMQDKQVDLKRVVENIKKADGELNDDIDPYLQEELFHGRSAKGVSDFLDFELKPLINEMRMRGVGMADFEEYLWNRHAEERNKQIAKINAEMPDGGSGIKTADAKAYLDALPSGKKESYASLAKRIDSINKKSQEILVASGLEKQSTIDAWNGAYQHYVPLHREDVETGHMGTGKGYSIRGNASKRATGSNKSVVDILANITQQRERNVVRSEKVRMSNALYGLAKANPNPDLWTVDEAPTERVVVNRGGKDEVVTRVVPGFAQRDNVIHTRINGEDHYIIMNEREPRAIRMAQAIKNLDADQLGRVLAATAKATRFLASINTQFNPIFGVVNLVRDAQGAMLNLSTTELKGQQKKVLGYTVSALRGVYADIRAHRRGEKPNSEWANLYEEFKLAGGQTGFRDQYENAAQRGEAIQKELASMDRNFVLKRAGAVFDWLSDYNEMMENASRLAAYRAAKEHGMSPERAASLAKNITVNFNRKGQVATQMGALYAFFNASTQGTARLAETMTGPMGKKIFVGGLLLGSMQAMLLAASGMGDDEPPEFVRERSLIIPDFVTGSGKYFSIPMPLGFHIIPNLARIPTEFVMSGFKNPANRIADLFGMFADTFNPIGNAGLSLQTIAPTVVDPLAALSENRDWTGKPIAKLDRDSMNPTPGYLRAKDTATTWSKGISYGLNLLTGGTDYKKGLFSPTPDQIDYLIGQATGGVGRETTKLEQTVMSGVTGEDMPLYKVPLIGRFIGDTQGQSAESGKFYAAMQRINEHENEIKGMMKHKRGGEVAEYIAENPESKLVATANHVERSIQKLKQVKRKAIEDGDSGRVKQVESLITQQMSAFNKRVQALSK